MLKDSLADFTNTLTTRTNSTPRISFEPPELLWQTLTIKRWEILKVMTGCGVLSIREVVRCVNRDAKAVHGDVHALLNAGWLKKSDDGVLFLPIAASTLILRYKRLHKVKWLTSTLSMPRSIP